MSVVDIGTSVWYPKRASSPRDACAVANLGPTKRAHVSRSGAPTTPYDAQMDKQFQALAERWRDETKLSSSISAKLRHPAYGEIIGLGPAVIPLILKELQDRPGYWFEALKALANFTPVPPGDRADPARAREAWLKWGREKGYL
jgi:hypothetical protein